MNLEYNFDNCTPIREFTFNSGCLLKLVKDSLCLRSWKVNRTTPAEDSSDSSNNFKRSAIFKNDSHKCRRKILANWTYLSPAGPKQDWTYLNLGQIITLNLLFLQRSRYIFVLYLFSLHMWPWIKPLDLNNDEKIMKWKTETIYFTYLIHLPYVWSVNVLLFGICPILMLTHPPLCHCFFVIPQGGPIIRVNATRVLQS